MELPDHLVVFAADVGKPKNLGWARRYLDNRSIGHGPHSLAQAVVSDMKAGLPVAIGFESPLFLPIAKNPEKLLSSRSGEKRRPWSAGAGPIATTSGIVAMIWVFRKIEQLLQQKPRAYTEWDAFAHAKTGHRLFIWEAFVSERQQAVIDVLGELPRSGKKWVVKKDYHVLFDMADALTAVNEFVNRVGQPSDVKAPPDAMSLSLVHTAVAWLEWATENVPIRLPPLVRKQHKPNWDAVPQLLGSAGEKMPVALEQCFTAK